MLAAISSYASPCGQGVTSLKVPESLPVREFDPLVDFLLHSAQTELLAAVHGLCGPVFVRLVPLSTVLESQWLERCLVNRRNLGSPQIPKHSGSTQPYMGIVAWYYTQISMCPLLCIRVPPRLPRASSVLGLYIPNFRIISACMVFAFIPKYD